MLFRSLGFDSGSQVGGPVLLADRGPLQCGVDVDIEHLGKDRRRELGRQGDQSCRTGKSDVGDAMATESSVEEVAGRSAWKPAGEQPHRTLG